MARERLRVEQWVVMIDQWRTSGLSLPVFCERHGICPGTMRNWVYKPKRKHAVENVRRTAQPPCETPIETVEVVESYPSEDPITPQDLAASLLHALGVDPGREVRDRFDRMVPLSTGQVKPSCSARDQEDSPAPIRPR